VLALWAARRADRSAGGYPPAMAEQRDTNSGNPAGNPEAGATSVVHVADHHRYEVRVDGALAGYAQYRRADGRFVFLHTEIEPAFEGRGLGSALARGALDDVRAQGQLVVPLCPFIHGWIDKHADYSDLVDRAMYDDLVGSR